jgi:hypothetical protein
VIDGSSVDVVLVGDAIGLVLPSRSWSLQGGRRISWAMVRRVGLATLAETHEVVVSGEIDGKQSEMLAGTLNRSWVGLRFKTG